MKTEQGYNEMIRQYATKNGIPYSAAKALLDSEFLDTVDDGGFSGLGDIPKGTDMLLQRNKKQLYSFDDIIGSYNKGLKEEEIRAWAWYKDYDSKDWKRYSIPDKELDGFVVRGHLFYDPEDPKGLVPYPIYAYGNIYDKLTALGNNMGTITERWGEAVYNRHKEVLEKVKPRMLSFADPDRNERPVLQPFQKMATEFTITRFSDAFRFPVNEEGVSLKDGFKKYMAQLPDSAFLASNQFDIWRYWVENNRFSKDLDKAEKENIQKNAPVEGAKLFSQYLFEGLHPDDRQKLDFVWNRQYNGHSSLPYNRVPIGFECSREFGTSPFVFTPIQREGIAFSEAVGSGIIAYDVGVGKTITAIITLANAMHSGRCKRPLVVVPKPTYKKWIKEIFGYTDKETGEVRKGVLSNTGITVNTYSNMTDAIKRYDLTKKVDANSITVVTYEGFTKLGFGEKAMEEHYEFLLKIMSLNNEGGGSDFSEREKEKNLQKAIEQVSSANMNTSANIEDLGFDFVVIDEAHNFKNVFAKIPKDEESGKKRFQVSTGISARAIKAFFHCNYIQRQFGRNVLLLTATPFTNNPLEIFSMLSLVGYDTFERYGYDNLIAFMETFLDEKSEWVNSYDGTIKQRPVVKGFNNRVVLQKIIYNHINYKTGEEAGVKRPCKLNMPKLKEETEKGLVYLPKKDQLPTFLAMNEMQEQNQAFINQYPNSTSDPFERKKRIMQALGMSLDNATSPFLFKNNSRTPDDFVDFVVNSPKIHYMCECVKSVKEYHEKHKQKVSGQVIYLNRGKDYFPMIKKYLLDRCGFSDNVKFENRSLSEVEIISSGISDSKKELVKQAFLAGVCKVIIGTATIREGIDLQKNGSVIYNGYCDWNPTDQKQLEGRIWRQGNRFGWVRVVQPLVQDSMDVFVYQKLEEKTNRVNEIWHKADRGNVLSIDSIDPEEVKFALYTNLKELAKIVVDRETKEIRQLITIHNEDIGTLTSLSRSIKKRNEAKLKCLDHIQTFKVALQGFFNDPDHYKERWGENDSGMKRYLERAEELIKMCEEYQTSEQTDKGLISLNHKLRQSTFANRGILNYTYSKYDFDDFKAAMVVIGKAKNSVFPKYNLNEDSDFSLAIEGISNKVQAFEKQVKEIKSDANEEKIIQDIRDKREKMRVDGMNTYGAVREFAKFHYLMDISAAEGHASDCKLPKVPKSAVEEYERSGSGIAPPKKQGRNASDFPLAQQIIPPSQFMATIENLRGEEGQFFSDKLNELEGYIQAAIDQGRKRSLGIEELTCYLHFFHGGSDWFVYGINLKNGWISSYAILNQDVQMSEPGDTSIDDFHSIPMMNVDYHYEPRPLAVALYEYDPEYFAQYETHAEDWLKKGEEPKPAKPAEDKTKKLKLLKVKAKALLLKQKQEMEMVRL